MLELLSSVLDVYVVSALLNSNWNTWSLFIVGIGWCHCLQCFDAVGWVARRASSL